MEWEKEALAVLTSLHVYLFQQATTLVSKLRHPLQKAAIV